LAHLRQVSLIGSDEQASDRIDARRKGLSRLIKQLVPRQIIAPPELGSKDVIGGFALSNRPSSAPPAPDWHSAQVLALLATSMRDPKLMSDQDELGWLLTGSLTARFLGQLMMDKPSCYYVPAMDEALGGMRLSLWDNRLSISATAMSLLALTEMQTTVDASEDLLPSGDAPAPQPSLDTALPGSEPSQQTPGAGQGGDDSAAPRVLPGQSDEGASN